MGDVCVGLIFVSQLAGVEQKLQAAEAALQGGALDARNATLSAYRHLGSTVAVTQHDVDTIVFQSGRALEYLTQQPAGAHSHHMDLGYAYLLAWRLGAAAARSTPRQCNQPGHRPFHHSPDGHDGLADVQELDNQLVTAAETYRQALQLAGDSPLPVACEGIWAWRGSSMSGSTLAAAQQHAQQVRTWRAR